MFRDEKLEMKVGLFIGAGIFLMFLIVFSISDMTLFKKGYPINVVFDYVNGITGHSPVRLAGVHAGDVKEIKIFFDEEVGHSRVRVNVWINGDTRIERDAEARINTLGLLGEQYLEISPGKEPRFLESGDTLIGVNPVNVGEQMAKMTEFMSAATGIIRKVENGEGTLGKLLVDDTLYNDLATIFGRLADGEGTIGKLLVKEDVYNNIEDFTSDIKAHPWKLLKKGSTKDK